jgi:hypothetical protein
MLGFRLGGVAVKAGSTLQISSSTTTSDHPETFSYFEATEFFNIHVTVACKVKHHLWMRGHILEVRGFVNFGVRSFLALRHTGRYELQPIGIKSHKVTLL